MKFYVVEANDGETVGCELTLKAAKALGEEFGGPFRIDLVEASVSGETIRRLLGSIGGYASEYKSGIYEKE